MQKFSEWCRAKTVPEDRIMVEVMAMVEPAPGDSFDAMLAALVQKNARPFHLEGLRNAYANFLDDQESDDGYTPPEGYELVSIGC